MPLTAIVLAAMALEWILLVAGTKRNEMLVGAASIFAAYLFLTLVHRLSTLRLSFTPRDLCTCWRIPWYLVTGSYEITIIFFKDILGLQRTPSFYRVSGFFSSKDDPQLVARRVLATLYTTAAPNFIILGIDYQQSRMLFHQIQRSSVPRMTQELGARR